MSIKKKPYRSYTLDEDKKDSNRRTLNIALNKQEQAILSFAMKELQQPKEGTAIKQLMFIGSFVLQDSKVRATIDLVFKNKKKNKRLGIIDFEE